MIYVRIPGNLRYRDLAVRAVAAASKLVGTGDRHFDDEVVSAFGEAFNNIALHGYRDHQGEVEIEIEVGADWLTIHLRDRGASFDVSDIPDPDLDTLPESGLGIFIIRSFMDEVSYLAGEPNLLSMTKRYSEADHGGTRP
ncbi:MAG: ATP-binding protein [Myxococcales bacterium]|nr:ATP-binding protein [Myxococcales bacterium]